MLTSDFLKSLPQDDPLLALSLIVNLFFEEIDNKNEGQRGEMSLEMIRAMCALQRLAKAHNLLEKLKLNQTAELTDNKIGNGISILKWFTEARAQIGTARAKKIVEESSEHFDAFFRNNHVLDLTDDEFQRIQKLINEMRDFLSAATEIGVDHKSRLLNRLERLQAELHRQMSNIDRFLGLAVDVAVAIGKCGDAIKPMTDRVAEVLSIVYGSHSRTTGLPGPTSYPQLPEYANNGPRPGLTQLDDDSSKEANA